MKKEFKVKKAKFKWWDKEKEFKTLSEKIIDEPELRMVYPILAVKDVKEFIKKEKRLIKLLLDGRISLSEFWKRRRKLVGGKLVE